MSNYLLIYLPPGLIFAVALFACLCRAYLAIKYRIITQTTPEQWMLVIALFFVSVYYLVVWQNLMDHVSRQVFSRIVFLWFSLVYVYITYKTIKRENQPLEELDAIADHKTIKRDDEWTGQQS